MKEVEPVEDVLPTESNQGEEETVLGKKRVKVVEFASITHQVKVLKMSREVGAV